MSLFLYRTFGQMAKVGLKVHQAADGFGVDFGVEISLEIVSIIELWRFSSGLCHTPLRGRCHTANGPARGLIFSPIARKGNRADRKGCPGACAIWGMKCKLHAGARRSLVFFFYLVKSLKFYRILEKFGCIKFDILHLKCNLFEES